MDILKPRTISPENICGSWFSLFNEDQVSEIYVRMSRSESLYLKKGQVPDSPSIFPTSHVIDHCGIAKTRQWVMIGTINPPPCLAFGTLVFPNEMRKTSSSKRLQQLFHGLSLFWDIDDTIGENPLLFIGLCSTMRRKRYLELLTAIN